MNETELLDLQYEYIVNLTKFFLDKYNKKELKTLEQVLHNVKSQAPYLVNFNYIFDEGIWMPDNPELYQNLIEFRPQLRGAPSGSYLPFRLYIKKGYNQKPILLHPGTLIWNNEYQTIRNKE